MFFLNYFFSLLLLVWICAGCEKEINHPVYKYHDISVPGADTVYSISFPDAHVGYAITDIGFYKTGNAGETWQPVDILTTSGIIRFHNRFFGVLPNGRITTDGGYTWTDNAPFKYAGMTEDGRVVALKKSSLDQALIYMTEPLDTVFTLIDTLHYYGISSVITPPVKCIECHLGYIVVIPYEIQGDYSPLMGHNYSTGNTVKVFDDFLQGQVDVCGGDNLLMICDSKGNIGYVRLPEAGSAEPFQLIEPTKYYSNHTDRYYGIDSYNDFCIAVGQSSIATDKQTGRKEDDYGFREVHKRKGDPSFNENFYIVDIIDDNTFVTTASGGKIYYGKWK